MSRDNRQSVMKMLSRASFKTELRGALVATEFRSCDVLNNVRNAADCQGVISAQAVVEYPDKSWALRGGFNIWQTDPSADFPVSVAIEAGQVSLVVPAGFQPRQGESRCNDRVVHQHFVSIGAIKQPDTELALS